MKEFHTKLPLRLALLCLLLAATSCSRMSDSVAPEAIPAVEPSPDNSPGPPAVSSLVRTKDYAIPNGRRIFLERKRRYNTIGR